MVEQFFERVGMFVLCMKVENKVLSGFNNDLGGFLVVVDQFQYNVEFFMQNCSFKVSDGVLNYV